MDISETARRRADEFIKSSGQFRLGELVTESSHPLTANLSEIAKVDTAAALDLLFQVDEDVVTKYREWVESGRSEGIARVVVEALLAGGRIFFTGCGATGRLSILLDSIWRGYWQSLEDRDDVDFEREQNWGDRTVSLMAGGDFALIKSVEGFEDITEFGKRQIEDAGVGPKDVVFAITEGGETSWVIGTAWKALEKGAKVYFVYNNPDDILREHVERSREVIDEPRIEKINLTTGPMAITGSTRMQATTIELCVMVTILEMALRGLLQNIDTNLITYDPNVVSDEYLKGFKELVKTLRSESVLSRLAELVETEELVYRSGGRVNYHADSFGIDVLTDTTERSPTFCVPAFRKWDDPDAAESWAFLFVPGKTTPEAWEHMLKRKPRPVEWTEDQVREMVSPEEASRRYEVIKRISLDEIYRFKIGQDGISLREPRKQDAMFVIADFVDKVFLFENREHVSMAQSVGAASALVYFGCGPNDKVYEEDLIKGLAGNRLLYICIPAAKGLLRGLARVAAKMLLNALSTCIMVRLGRVMGNYMIYVVPSNLKLIDRATRYITRLTELSYDDACRLLFDIIEYVEPRMETGQAYPPVVGMAVIRVRDGVGNEEAERILNSELR